MTALPNPGPELDALAERICDALFTNGSGAVATRLVLMDRQMYLGGWCRAAVADQIKAAILAIRASKEPA